MPTFSADKLEQITGHCQLIACRSDQWARRGATCCSIEKLSGLDCRPPPTVVYTGRRDIIMPAYLRRGHDPPREAV
jgi:hypothetical protein